MPGIMKSYWLLAILQSNIAPPHSHPQSPTALPELVGTAGTPGSHKGGISMEKIPLKVGKSQGQ